MRATLNVPLAIIEGFWLVFLIGSALIVVWSLIIALTLNIVLPTLYWYNNLWDFLGHFPEGWITFWVLVSSGMLAGKLRAHLNGDRRRVALSHRSPERRWDY